MPEALDLGIRSDVIRSLIGPISREEILRAAITLLERTLSARFDSYKATRIQIAVNELMGELVGEGLFPKDEVEQLQEEARQGEIWLDKWYRNLESLETTLKKPTPSGGPGSHAS